MNHKTLPLVVTCTECRTEFEETEIEVMTVEEGIQGYDIVEFICPVCGKWVHSYRR